MTESGSRGLAQGGRSGDGTTLLVVDDEPFILSALVRFFEHMLPGARVKSASTCADGLAYVASGDVDLIISDYRMPDMDGISFLVRCSEISPDALRVLFTAHADPAVEVEAHRKAHVAAFVPKGADPMLLLNAVRTALAAVPA